MLKEVHICLLLKVKVSLQVEGCTHLQCTTMGPLLVVLCRVVTELMMVRIAIMLKVTPCWSQLMT